MCFYFTSNENCHFTSENPQNGLLIFVWKETHSEKIMEIEDFDEKSYNNNDKPWTSSKILRVPHFSSFFIFSIFPSFSFFFIFSFFLLLFDFFMSFFLFFCSRESDVFGPIASRFLVTFFFLSRLGDNPLEAPLFLVFSFFSPFFLSFHFFFFSFFPKIFYVFLKICVFFGFSCFFQNACRFQH